MAANVTLLADEGTLGLWTFLRLPAAAARLTHFATLTCHVSPAFAGHHVCLYCSVNSKTPVQMIFGVLGQERRYHSSGSQMGRRVERALSSHSLDMSSQLSYTLALPDEKSW